MYAFVPIPINQQNTMGVNFWLFWLCFKQNNSNLTVSNIPPQTQANSMFLIIKTPSYIPFPFKASDNFFYIENIAR